MRSPFGKNLEIAKCRIPFDVKEMIDKERHELGITESELLRNILLVHYYGIDKVESIHRDRLSVVTSMYTRSKNGERSLSAAAQTRG